MYKTETCTVSASMNKYHKDDIINEFLEWIRYTGLESDAINNIPVIIKWYEKRRKYTFLEKLRILFK